MPRTIKLIAIRDHRVLLVFKGSTIQWSLPGGKTRGKKEDDVTCLRRELFEELPRARMRKLRRWRRFNRKVRSKRFTITAYFGKVTGPLISDNEIDAAAWVSTWRRIALSGNTRHILEMLTARGYLKR